MAAGRQQTGRRRTTTGDIQMATTEKQTSESSGQGAAQARSGTYLLFSAVGVVLSVLYWNGRLAGAEQAGFNRMLLRIFFVAI